MNLKLLRIKLLLVVTIICFTSLYAQNPIKNKSQFKIKITDNFYSEIKNNLSALSSAEKGGYINFGVTSLDELSSAYSVKGIKPLFSNGGKFEKRHQKFGLHLWYTVTVDENTATNINECIRKFGLDKNVTVSEPFTEYALLSENSGTSAEMSFVPNDPQFSAQWQYNNTGQTGGLVGADIDLVSAWDDEMGDTNVIVAIIDVGVQYNHPDLADNMWVNYSEKNGTTGVDDDGNGFTDDIYGFNFVNNTGNINYNSHYHGTHVAGTVSAVTNNGIGVSGIAGGSGSGDGVRLMSCQIFDPGYGGGENALVYAADNGAVIAQNSWGNTSPGYIDQAVLDAVDYFIANAGFDELGNQVGPMAGGIVIFAAGNSDSNADYYPAYYESCFAVASTNHNDQKAWYSNYGTWVEVSAPGGETSISQEGVLSTYTISTYNYLQGTSMACPHVSGVAALIVSKFQGTGFSPDIVWERLISSADPIDALNPTYTGQMGSGRLNAYRSLEEYDSIPPANITDLAAIDSGVISITLSLTATGASADSGKASAYDLRYSESPIDSANFEGAIRFTKAPKPKMAGELDTIIVTGVLPNTTYYFAIKAIDNSGYKSGISNVINVSTLPAPRIEISPATIVHSQDSGLIGTQVFTIYNTGQGTLNFNIANGIKTASMLSTGLTQVTDNDKIINNIAELGAKDITLTGNTLNYRVEGITKNDNGESISYNYPTSVELTGIYSGVHVLFYSSYDSWNVFRMLLVANGAATSNYYSSLTQDILDSIDILVIDDNYYPSTSEITIVNTWIQNGGSILIDADQNIDIKNGLINGSGIMYSTIACSSGTSTNITSHEIADSVTAYYINGPVASLDCSGGSISIIRDNYGRNYLAAAPLGDGKVIAIADESLMGSYLNYEGHRKIGLNSMGWLANYNRDWLSLDTLDAQVAPGSSLNITATFDSDSLTPDNYFKKLNIESNDPVSPVVNLSVQLHVNGMPDISLNQDSLNFGEVFVSYTDSLQIIITNSGTDSLIISNITTNTSQFNVISNTSLSIPAKDIDSIYVGFKATSVTSYTDTLKIFNNVPSDPIVKLVLKGKGVNPPIISVIPDSIGILLFTGDSVAETLTINNTTGGSNLYWNANYDFISSPSAIRDRSNDIIRINMEPHETAGIKPNVNPSLNSVDIPFKEGFESGSFSNWTDDGGSGTKEITSVTAAKGTKSFHYANTFSGHFHGIHQEFNGNPQPEYISFSVRSGSTSLYDGYTVFTSSGVGYEIIWFSAGGDGHFYCNGNVGGDNSFSYSANTWYKIEYKDIDWVNKIFDYYVDGNLIKADIPFRNAAYVTSIDELYLYNYNSSEAWWDEINVGGSALEWLSLPEHSGTVAQGTSQDIDVIFDAEGLYGGLYTANINISSNDPATPSVNVPVSMVVTGLGNICTYSDSIYYEIGYIGYSITDSILITNCGTDSLKINDIVSDNPDYTVDITKLILLPEEETYLNVHFLPSSAGVITGNLNIHSNDSSDLIYTINLIGNGADAPIIAVDPDSVSVSLFTGDTLSEFITIDNSAGGSDLIVEYNMENLVSGSSIENRVNKFTNLGAKDVTISDNILNYRVEGTSKNDKGESISYNYPMSVELNNAYNGVSVMFYNNSWSSFRMLLEASSATTSVYYGSITNDILDTIDILVIDDNYTPSTAEITIVNSWIQNGGSILIDADQQYDIKNALINGSGILYNSTMCSSGTTTDIASHEITDSVTAYYIYGPVSSLDCSGGSISLIRDNYGRHYLAAAPLGDGKVVAICDESLMDGYLSYEGHTKVGLNAIGWLSDGSSWVSLSDKKDTISAGHSVIKKITFDATDKIGGNYNALLTITSNDPANPVVEVPLHMEVTGIPNIEFDKDTVNYGIIFIGQSKTDTLEIYNSGTDSLIINSITSTSTEFSVDTTSLYILPDNRYSLLVTYSPLLIADTTAILSIESNDSSNLVANVILTGTGIYPPVISVSPDSIEIMLKSGDSLTTYLVVSNETGQSNLSFSASSNFINMTVSDIKVNSETTSTSIVNIERVPEIMGVGDTSILIIQDNSSWGVYMYDYVYNNFGIISDVIWSQNISSSDLSNYDLIITVGAQYGSYYDSINANKEKFEDFVKQGGIMQYQVATMGYSVELAGNALSIYGNNENYNDVVDTLHPIVDSVPNPFYGNSANHNYFNSLPVSANIITRTSSSLVPTTVEYQLGSGYVIATGTTIEYLYDRGYPAGQMLYNMIAYNLEKAGKSWLKIEPETGNIAAGQKDSILVTIDASNVGCGDFNANIQVTSNAPLTPVVQVPVHLVVNHSAILEPEVTSCSGGSVNLSIANIASCQWSTGETTKSITVSPAADTIFSVSFIDNYGCNASENVNVIISKATTTTKSVSICEGDSIFMIDKYVKEEGIFIETLSNVYGCDSMVITDLNLEDLPAINLGKDVSINTEQSVTLDAGNGYILYKWNTGDTTQTITVDGSTGKGKHQYSVKVVDENSCSNSDTIVVNIKTGIFENAGITYKLYPNPVNNNKLYITTDAQVNNSVITLYNMNGQVVKIMKIESLNNSTSEIDITNLSAGTYILKINVKGYEKSEIIEIVR